MEYKLCNIKTLFYKANWTLFNLFKNAGIIKYNPHQVSDKNWSWHPSTIKQEKNLDWHDGNKQKKKKKPQLTDFFYKPTN